MITLQLARYRFHWRVSTPLQLPHYASSTLRGVFGHSLRQQLCLTRASECRGCALLKGCAYPPLFEPQRVPRPAGSLPALAAYAIETPFSNMEGQQPQERRYRPGEHYAFDMVLMTPQAISQLQLIVLAWKRAFTNGVGRRDGTAELIGVEHLLANNASESIYSRAVPQLKYHLTEVSTPQFSTPEDVTLCLQTPLRIEHQGRLIRARDMTAGLFLRHLIRRVSFQVSVQQPEAFTLEDIHQLNALADRVLEKARQLQWHDWARYSTRQQQKMTLGGLVGQWQLLQVPPQILPFIYLGQWLHVGKESTFGLGKYQWLNIE